jgi:hypothetical protein
MSIFFKDMFSLSLSQGSTDNILEEMNQKSETANKTIQERINEKKQTKYLYFPYISKCPARQ